MRRISTTCLLLLVFGLLGGESRAERDSGAIRLLARAQVPGERITLGELGVLAGEAVEFDAIDLGYAPDPGSTRRISGASILAKLRDAGMDDARIQYTIPASVRVRRSHQEIDPEELRVAIQRRLEDWLPPGDELETIDLPPRLRVPLGDYAIRIHAPQARNRDGHTAEIEIEQDGRVVARGPARLRIASRGMVVVARRAIARGAILRAEDLRVEERVLRGLPATSLAGAEAAIGRRAAVSIPPGKVVTSRLIEVPILVERGDRIRVAVETSGMRLTVPAEALDSAGLGERVRLLNPSSGREFTAEVIAHGKALVHY